MRFWACIKKMRLGIKIWKWAYCWLRYCISLNFSQSAWDSLTVGKSFHGGIFVWPSNLCSLHFRPVGISLKIFSWYLGPPPHSLKNFCFYHLLFKTIPSQTCRYIPTFILVFRLCPLLERLPLTFCPLKLKTLPFLSDFEARPTCKFIPLVTCWPPCLVAISCVLFLLHYWRLYFGSKRTKSCFSFCLPQCLVPCWACDWPCLLSKHSDVGWSKFNYRVCAS